MFANQLNGPSTLTILPTYRCTAACKQCCFGSNPNLHERLSLKDICETINEAVKNFPSIKQVVFSGGECMMLGDELYKSIAHASNNNLLTRIVSNGYWGSTDNRANLAAKSLMKSGLNELNISSGRDHAEYVPVESVLNAAVAATSNEIFTLITVEQDADDSEVIQRIKSDDRFMYLMSLGEKRFRFQINSWMQFNIEHKDREITTPQAEFTPCGQLFSNLVVTPHGNISACCGLTFEHIPEMRIGTIKNGGLKAAYEAESNDFMKIWIHNDGPDGILRKVYDGAPPRGLISKDHICDTCARMHKCKHTRSLIRQSFSKFYGEVMLRHSMKHHVINGLNVITNQVDEIGAK